MDASAADPEAELERFREQWRAEVARNKRPQDLLRVKTSENQTQYKDGLSAPPTTGPSTARKKDVQRFSEEVEPKAYHDLPDKEELLKLGVEGQSHDRKTNEEPSSALEHYERAVEKETQGHLGDSIKHYRKAYKVRINFHPSTPLRV